MHVYLIHLNIVRVKVILQGHILKIGYNSLTIVDSDLIFCMQVNIKQSYIFSGDISRSMSFFKVKIQNKVKTVRGSYRCFTSPSFLSSGHFSDCVLNLCSKLNFTFKISLHMKNYYHTNTNRYSRSTTVHDNLGIRLFVQRHMYKK